MRCLRRAARGPLGSWFIVLYDYHHETTHESTLARVCEDKNPDPDRLDLWRRCTTPRQCHDRFRNGSYPNTTRLPSTCQPRVSRRRSASA